MAALPLCLRQCSRYLFPPVSRDLHLNTLVFEIAGNVEEFVRAVNAIEGLEWQGEYDLPVTPNEDFYSDYLKITKRFFYDKVNGISIQLTAE